jgi:hypothetical protein
MEQDKSMPAKRETKAEPAQTLPPPGRVLSAQWDDRSTFTVLETAEILGLSSWAAWQAVNNGNIPTVRIGRRIIVPRHGIERLLGAV